MSANDTLNKVRTLLGLDTKLEQMKLENGTILEADKFQAGEPVFIITDDEKVALPAGSYELENGYTLSVEDEGVIKSYELEENEEMEHDEDHEMGYVSREEFELALEEIKKMIDELTPEEEEVEEEVEEEIEEEETEELSEEVNEEQKELKEELSKPASNPIKHNPEGENKPQFNLKYAQKRSKSTFDIVLEKLAKK